MATDNEIYEKSLLRARNMDCPDCNGEGTLEYADDEVLVCRACQFSIDAVDLQDVWEDKLWEEEGMDDFDDNEFDDDDDESISVYDAALIWASNGKDEDYMFGYTEEELENALR